MTQTNEQSPNKHKHKQTMLANRNHNIGSNITI